MAASFSTAVPGCASGAAGGGAGLARPSQNTVPSERRLIRTSSRVPTSGRALPPTGKATPPPTPLCQPPVPPPMPIVTGGRRPAAARPRRPPHVGEAALLDVDDGDLLRIADGVDHRPPEPGELACDDVGI